MTQNDILAVKHATKYATMKKLYPTAARVARVVRADITVAFLAVLLTAVTAVREERDRRVDITVHHPKQDVKYSVKITFYHHHRATQHLIATVLSSVFAVIHHHHHILHLLLFQFLTATQVLPVWHISEKWIIAVNNIRNPKNVIRPRIAPATTAATNHPVTHHLFALATTAATNHPVTHHLIALATTAATNHPVSFVHMALARIAALVIPILGVPLNVLPVETVVYHHRVMPVLSATAKLWVFAALVMTVFIVILSTKTAVNYYHAHAHRPLSPLLHQHLSHQHPSVTKSVTKNVIVIMDLRVVVKEEKVDIITEDVIFNAPTISYSPTAIT